MFVFQLILSWLGIALEYLIAAAMILGGAYLAVLFDLAATNPLAWLIRPLRIVGYALIACGLLLGAYTYGKSIGGAAIEAEWRAKNLEAEIARLRLERDAKTAAAEEARNAEQEIRSRNDEANQQLASYKAATDQLSGALAACRRATDDDVRRLCDITGRSAPGCKPAKRM